MIKKFLKFIGIILLILILLLLIHTTRNFIIVSKLQNNISNYKNSTNYQAIMTSKEIDASFITINYYKKDDKEASFLESISEDQITNISTFKNNEKINIYSIYDDLKIASLDATEIREQLSNENNLRLLKDVISKLG